MFIFNFVFSLNIRLYVAVLPFFLVHVFFKPQIKEEFIYKVYISNVKSKFLIKENASKFNGVRSTIMTIVVNFCELKIYYMNQ